uniref:Alpha N-terminal protein methyltransferase 1 n=1 Tax=Soboliphyme baturini TaxID=241478 RepID=A0A183IMJ0_9BILA
LFQLSLPTDHALDCGSGIGRVTKCVLSKFFDHIDLVDVTQKFLDESVSYLGKVNVKVNRRICCGLQDLIPERGRYNMIWIQWVASHLIDSDLGAFLKRCRESLSADGGVVVLKENISRDLEQDFDELDHSWTRSRQCFLNLFRDNDLQLVSEHKQRNFPQSIYEVRMFAVQ